MSDTIPAARAAHVPVILVPDPTDPRRAFAVRKVKQMNTSDGVAFTCEVVTAQPKAVLVGHAENSGRGGNTMFWVDRGLPRPVLEQWKTALAFQRGITGTFELESALIEELMLQADLAKKVAAFARKGFPFVYAVEYGRPDWLKTLPGERYEQMVLIAGREPQTAVDVLKGAKVAVGVEHRITCLTA